MVRPYSTIKDMACDLLSAIAYYEDKTLDPSPDNRVEPDHPDARTVGVSFPEIARRVKEKFPDSKTDSAAIRRLQGRIRAQEPYYEHYVLPQRRPRANQKKPG